MMILATASASDEVAPFWWHVAWICFISGTALALGAFGAAFFCRVSSGLRVPRWLAGLAIAVSLITIGFAAYIHHIDYVEVGGDGTPASRPLWRVLLIPSLPVLASILAIAICRTREFLSQSKLPMTAAGEKG